MEIIKNYLDSIFENLPMSDETQRAKKELEQMMEDKYLQLISEGFSENEAIGQVISEFGNIEEIKKEIFSDEIISTDETSTEKIEKIHISSEDVDGYFANLKRVAKKISIGSFLCVISPSLLVFLAIFMEDTSVLNENVWIALGLAFLFAMVAIAAFIFISVAGIMDKYEKWRNTPLDLDPIAKTNLLNSFPRDNSKAVTHIGIGVSLCILASAQICIVAMLNDESTSLAFSLLAIFVLVASALPLFIPSTMIKEAYNILLEVNEYEVKANLDYRKGYDVSESLGQIFWPIIVAIYLLWSFISFDWHITWIVWPIAALIFASILGLYKVKNK